MHGQAVKYKHIASVDLAAHPIAFCQCFRRDLGNMQILVLVFDNAETVRAFQNLQGTQVGRAIVKRNPDRKALGVSTHEAVILMRMNRETIAIWENQPSDRLGVNQNPLAHQHLHDTFQGGMMRQRMKRFQVENFLVGSLE